MKTITAPPLGTVIKGHTLVARTPTHHDEWIGLFTANDRRLWHQYATWRMYWHENRWEIESGDYSQTLAGGVGSYVNRGGNIDEGHNR